MKKNLLLFFRKIMFQLCMMLVMLVCSVSILNAQAVTLPYFCGFEDPAENALWTIVKGSAYNNTWVFGTAEANQGTHSMYISCDNGATASYTTTKGSAIAYRTFNLPAGRYQVDFDWMALGNGTDMLYCAWVSSTTEPVNAWATNNNGAGSGVKMYAKPWQTYGTSSDTIMSSYATWQHGSFEVNSAGTPVKLVFFWTNAQTSANNPGGCIDNVQINLKTACPKPTNLTFNMGSTADVGTLTWSSNANSWDVMYKNSNDVSWTTHNNVTQRIDSITGLTKGIYTFWVRAHCDDDTSSWTVITNVLVYTSLAACVDYIDLNGPNVTCHTGVFSNPYQLVGKVDNGFLSSSSRHTVHYGLGAYDPRTGNGLPTVPRGEVASVRLGNWEINAKAESITYDILIDSSATILLLKYAVVLQDPNHGYSEQPRFRLELLDQNGSVIDPTCGVADFVPGTNTQDWHVYGSGYDIVKWKDWTTMGLNLSPYIGQTIKVRFTTYDCNASGHYGYAYFTLDCAQALLEGETCGGATTTSIRAPEGFAYQWYSVNNPGVIVSTNRTFSASENDTSDYICKVMLLENPNCYFNLTLSLLPKWPVSQSLTRWAPRDCKNRVEFMNKSFINSNRGATTDVPSTYYWSVTNGQTSRETDPIFTFPNEGGQYTVTLVSSMAEDQCLDTLLIDINVPPILDYDTIVKANICEDGTYIHNKKPYTDEGLYVDTFKTFCGCDSIVTLNLQVHAEFKEYVYDTICEGTIYDFNGYMLSTTGVYTDTLLSSMGCDSIVTLYLQVNPVLSIVFDPVAEICADDPNFTITFTPSYNPTSYAINFGATALAAGFVDIESPYLDNSITVTLPDVCPPDYYTANIIFYDSTYFCGNVIMPMNFAVLYPDTIMKQKFNNVISLKNSDFNGGFNFTSYQWYKNGAPIPGETSSYIYLGEGNTLSTTDNYRVSVTRADGSSLMSCPYTPKSPRPAINITPSIVGPSEQIRITILGKGEAKLWTTGGILLRSVTLYENNYIIAPSEPGVYLLQVVDESERRVERIVVTNTK